MKHTVDSSSDLNFGNSRRIDYESSWGLGLCCYVPLSTSDILCEALVSFDYRRSIFTLASWTLCLCEVGGRVEDYHFCTMDYV